MFSTLKSELNKTKQENNLVKKIDSIFTDFILNQSLKDLNQHKNINFYKRIQEHNETNIYKSINSLEIKNLNVLQKKINNRNSEQINKKQLSKDLSLFYSKIYEIYNVIMITLDPVYSYKNDDNKEILFRLSTYEDHINNIKNKKITLKYNYSNSSIIDKRLRIMESAFNNSGNPNLDIDAICKLQSYDNKSMSLYDLKGIKELEKLFFYTNIDNNSKKIEPKYQKLLDQRLDLFYKLYTGKNNKRPKEINSFDKISLLDFDKKSKYCKGKNKSIIKNLPKVDNEFFKLYTKNLHHLNKSLEKRKNNLLKILNFIFIKDKKTNKHIINKKVNYITLTKLNFYTIDNVSRIFLNIQHYFFQSLLIF